MIINRTTLLTLTCARGGIAAFAQISSAQTGSSATTSETGVPVYDNASTAVTSPIVAGGYRGLLTGTSGVVEGVLTAHIESSGDFTGALNLSGTVLPLVGVFNSSGVYSKALSKNLAVSLAFTGTGSLTGTVTDSSQTFSYSGTHFSNMSSAGGRFSFIISPGQIVGSGSSAPEGTGYGVMYVHINGEVSLLGKLPDGANFTTESWVTSGSTVSIYSHMGTAANTGLSGTLVFQDIPNTTDCSGTLNWIKAANPNSKYPAGFELATVFQAAQYNRVIGGLYHDVVTFTATGADLNLKTPFTTTLTLTPDGALYHGDAESVQFAIQRTKTRDEFFGSFVDPVTQLRRPFRGLLLPKSRTGGGIFFSESLSGTVTVQY